MIVLVSKYFIDTITFFHFLDIMKLDQLSFDLKILNFNSEKKKWNQDFNTYKKLDQLFPELLLQVNPASCPLVK